MSDRKQVRKIFLTKDFIIQNDSELVWANLGLDGLLEIGDVLVVEYFF